MTEPRDDRPLEDYLQRNSSVSQHYRNLDSDDVPAALDAAVISRARDALAAKPKVRPAWTRWSAPLALAASLVMAVAVVLEIGVDERLEVPAPRAMPSQGAAAPADEAESSEAIEQVTEQPVPFAPPPRAQEIEQRAAAPAIPQRQIKARDLVGAAQKREVPQESAASKPREEITFRAEPTSSLAGVAPPAVPPPLAEDLALSDRRLVAAEREAQNVDADAGFARLRGQPAPATAMRPASAPVSHVPQAAQTPHLEPVVWLEQIRTLRRKGKVLEADEQWRQFVGAYPDVVVAVDDFARPKP